MENQNQNQNPNQHINPNDKDLQKFIKWMISSVAIRELLKKMIAAEEVKDTIWLASTLSDIENRRG